LSGGQIVLLWIAVLEAGVKMVKMGADNVLSVSELVPNLRLKEKGYAPPTLPPPPPLPLLLLPLPLRHNSTSAF
jgi:hypothetical protein